MFPRWFFSRQIVPAASASQLTLVDLVCALGTLQTDTVLHLVKEVVRRPPQARGDQVRSPGDLSERGPSSQPRVP